MGVAINYLFFTCSLIDPLCLSFLHFITLVYFFIKIGFDLLESLKYVCFLTIYLYEPFWKCRWRGRLLTSKMGIEKKWKLSNCVIPVHSVNVHLIINLISFNDICFCLAAVVSILGRGERAILALLIFLYYAYVCWLACLECLLLYMWC